MTSHRITPAMLTLGAAVALGSTAMAVPNTARAACGGKMQSSCSAKSQDSMNNMNDMQNMQSMKNMKNKKNMKNMKNMSNGGECGAMMSDGCKSKR